jgi:hypothetical protein
MTIRDGFSTTRTRIADVWLVEEEIFRRTAVTSPGLTRRRRPKRFFASARWRRCTWCRPIDLNVVAATVAAVISGVNGLEPPSARFHESPKKARASREFSCAIRPLRTS